MLGTGGTSQSGKFRTLMMACARASEAIVFSTSGATVGGPEVISGASGFSLFVRRTR